MAAPNVDKLTPTDSRVQHLTYKIPASGKTYHYLLAEPPAGTRAAGTIVLIHGFPDLAFGWRYQVPHLLSALNLRVVVPDLPGFGRTDVPHDLAAYSFKAVSDDLVNLVRHVQAQHHEETERFFVGGHDWGGAVAWRFALWHAELLRGVFSVCTPFWAPSEVFLTKEEVVERLPNFGYQAQFERTEVEEAVVGRDKIRTLLGVMYGAQREDKQPAFTIAKGVDLEKLEVGKFGESPLVSREELDFYADEYARNGMKGPLSWYKTNRVNYDEEKGLLEKGKTRVTVPSLMVVASRDGALPPAMSAGMDQHFDSLVMKEVDATHWALWERPAEVNQHIDEFLRGILKEQPLKASI